MASAPPLHSEITCNVCLEICENPQCLKCLHFFCSNCVQKIKQGTKIQCPDCRQTCSVSEVKKDFRIQKLIDKYSHLLKIEEDVGPFAPIVCDACKNSMKSVKSYCNFCEQFLCTHCDTAHKGSTGSKDHKLVDFLQLCEEKQRDIKKQMKKLQDTKIYLRKDASNTKSLLKQIVKSEDIAIEEINHYRRIIKRRVDQHHDKLIDEVKSINETLKSTLQEAEKLFEQCGKKIDDDAASLSKVFGSMNYSLMTDTLSILSKQIEKDLQEFHSHLPEVSPDVPNIMVLKGDEYDPIKSTAIKVIHSRVKETKEESTHTKVG